VTAPRIESLPSTRHAVYRLAPDLLLVFKPRGHRESPHRHPTAQKLTVLRGRLRVDTRRCTVVLSERRPTLALAAGREHATEAIEGTWLLAERRRR
jgi:quercetin dioxygenase-like cupin family protein